MKLILITSIVTLLSFSGFAQKSQPKEPLPLATYNDNLESPLTAKEKMQIEEVYGNEADKYVYKNSQRLKEIKHILRNRVVVEYYENKDLTSITPLSEVPLLNAINKNMKRDYNFDAENFNPLKYAFHFFSSEKQIIYYRANNTQYLIKILPQY